MEQQFTVTSAHEAAFNAAGEAMSELGLIGSLSRSNDLFTDSPFMFVCKVGADFVAGSGATPALAFATFAERARVRVEEQARDALDKTSLRSAPAVKEAALALVDEYRDREGAAVLNELADRIAAIPVKA